MCVRTGSSLRDLSHFFYFFPALKRWAKLGRTSGADSAVLRATRPENKFSRICIGPGLIVSVFVLPALARNAEQCDNRQMQRSLTTALLLAAGMMLAAAGYAQQTPATTTPSATTPAATTPKAATTAKAPVKKTATATKST